MKRINIIGNSGSGKSTVGRAIAQALDIPYIEMDALYWQSNWGQPSDEEFFANLHRILASESWVLDGNYSRTTSIKWALADTVVWIDYSFRRTFIQLLKRTIQRAWYRQELWPDTGNRESFAKSFLSRDSILWWMITHYKKVKTRYQRLMTAEEYKHVHFIHLTTPQETEQFLSNISNVQL